MQARLLRVLQERSLIPVGGTEPIQVDVRLLAATKKSLRDEVEHRRFREDLMYQVRVVPLFLPPLVERDGDVEPLTWFFIKQFNEHADRQNDNDNNNGNDNPPWRRIDAIAPETYARLLAYQWPGNVRELRNVTSSRLSSAASRRPEPPEPLGARCESSSSTLEFKRSGP